ncbi:MAG: GGDEF domain-containing response regulator, partial [Campylobacterales bacterium]|nr:GGDEF domain-containing response regulator [Campylobacterales bacterium]
MEDNLKTNNVRELTKEFVVLFIEDDSDTRNNMLSLLESFFFKVDTAEDGSEGLKKYNQFFNKNGYFYDIVITDLEMPKINGFDLVNKLKSINPELHAIISSAYSDINNLKEAINIGVDGFLEKPFNQHNFYNVLYNCAKCILSKNDERIKSAELKKAVDIKTKIIAESLKIDNMTQLPNSVALTEKLKTITKEHITVLLDIDRYSDINYTYGVEFGDQLLLEIVELLKTTIPAYGQLFRLGSDEFIVLIEGNLLEATSYAEMVLGFFKTHLITHDDIDIRINWNIGISTEKEDQISTAKLAIKILKDNQGMPYKIYKHNSELLKSQKENINKAHILKELLVNDPVRPYFQPIVDVQTKEIVKYEALARLHDNSKCYYPDEFLESAKATKMLSVITKNMISKSLKIAKEKNIAISLNISQQDFNSDYLVDFLKIATMKNKIEPKNVSLEILEDIATNDNAAIAKQINNLKELGFIIAIDDFGSENANFSRLLDIKADLIKIDGLFIKDLDTNEESVKIVRSIVYLA